MKKDGLRRFYDRLTPERFRLLVEAAARGDEGECRNLNKSCPRVVYEMNDASYEDRVRASEEITVLTCLDLAPWLAKLRMLVAFSDALPLLRNICLDEAHTAYFEGSEAGTKRGWGATHREGDPPQQEDDTETGEALNRITARMESEWNIFSDFLGRLERDVVEELSAM